MVVFDVKRYKVREAKIGRYAVRKAKIGRYAVCKAKIGRYAVRKGEGCHPHISLCFDGYLISSKHRDLYQCMYTILTRMTNGHYAIPPISKYS